MGTEKQSFNYSTKKKKLYLYLIKIPPKIFPSSVLYFNKNFKIHFHCLTNFVRFLLYIYLKNDINFFFYKSLIVFFSLSPDVKSISTRELVLFPLLRSLTQWIDVVYIVQVASLSTESSWRSKIYRGFPFIRLECWNATFQYEKVCTAPLCNLEPSHFPFPPTLYYSHSVSFRFFSPFLPLLPKTRLSGRDID